MINKEELIDAPERRSVPASQFEFRTAGNTLRFTGYASVFDRGYDVHGGANAGGWTEYVTRKAFDVTLKSNPDVHLLINHDGLPLARTKSGTLKLGVDSQGLLSEADLDLRDHTVRSLAIKMERGDVDEMSFAFRVKKQTWSADESERNLDEVSLHKGDVSIVSFGANPYTSATLRSAVRHLASGELREDELAELRADEVDRAVEALRSARTIVDLGNRPSDRILTIDEARDPQDGDGPGPGEPDDSPLAQAIHDLVVDAGAECGGDNEPDEPSIEGFQNNTLTLEDATKLAVTPGNITIADAMRMMRPDNSPNPISIADAEAIAS